MMSDEYILGKTEQFCHKLADHVALFHRNDMCHVSLHTMDRFEGEPEQWAVSISGSGNVSFNFIHENEKMCRVKFAEILGQDLITIDIITSLGLKSD